MRHISFPLAMIRTLGLVLAILLLLCVAYVFLAGPLFAYFPGVLGYERVEGERTRVVAYDVANLPAYYENAPAILKRIEAHFNLTYRKPVNIVALQTKREFTRTIPWLSANVIGAAALETGDIVLVNREKIGETAYEEEEFLAHELVHALQFQNSSIRHTLTMHRHIWMREGVAVHAGGPTYYATPADYRSDYLGYRPAINPDTTSAQIWKNVPPGGGKFSYTFYGAFIGYLIDTHGLPAFQAFFARYLEAPAAFRGHAEEVFGDPFVVLQERFLEAGP